MIPSPSTAEPPFGLTLRLPGFAGTPYLATRVEPDLYHILLLPRAWPLYSQLNVAFRQAEANRLETHFLPTPDSCLWFQSGGGVVPARVEPSGVAVTHGKLACCEALPEDADMARRGAELRAYARDQGLRTIGSDPDRGGWTPSEGELRALGGGRPGDVPKGLERCLDCGEWRGTCLDPSRPSEPLVLPVPCACDNDNRCARCGEPFFQRRLQSNWYDEEDRALRYVPGFYAFEHACG